MLVKFFQNEIFMKENDMSEKKFDQELGSQYQTSSVYPTKTPKYVQDFVDEYKNKPYDFSVVYKALAQSQINNGKSITFDDIRNISYEDALIKLGKYVPVEHIRNSIFDFVVQKQQSPAQKKALVSTLSSYLDDFFVHQNFKLDKSKIPSNHPHVETQGDIQYADTTNKGSQSPLELQDIKSKPRIIKQEDSTGIVREFVDVPWATTGLALAPFHSLFYRTDKMRITEDSELGITNDDHPTIVPSFYDTILEEIQDVSIRLLGGTIQVKGNQISYESELEMFFRNISVKKDAQTEIRNQITNLFNDIKTHKATIDSPIISNYFDPKNPNALINLIVLNHASSTSKVEGVFVLNRIKDLCFLWHLRYSVENIFNFSATNPNAHLLDLTESEQVSRRQELPIIDSQFDPKKLKTTATLCPHATSSCKHSCLITSGNNTLAGTNIVGRFFNPTTNTTRTPTEITPSRDLSPYQTYNLAKKMYASLMLYKEPVAFCRVMVECFIKFAIRKDRFKDFLVNGKDSPYFADFANLSDYEREMKFNIGAIKKSALDQKENLPIFIRLNVYSDIPWELFFPSLFEIFDGEHTLADIMSEMEQAERSTHKSLKLDTKIPYIMFYDYTKVPNRGPFKYNDQGQLLDVQSQPILEPNLQGITYENHKSKVQSLQNYHLTFSFGGTNTEDCIKELYFNQKNITVAFYKMNKGITSDLSKRLSKAAKTVENPKDMNTFAELANFFYSLTQTSTFPKTFLGYDVIDGDLYDNRTFDRLFQSKGLPVVIGLKWKEIRIGLDYKVSTPLNDSNTSLFSFVRLPDLKIKEKTVPMLNINLHKDSSKLALVLNSKKDILNQLKQNSQLVQIFEQKLDALKTKNLEQIEALKEMYLNLFAYYKLVEEYPMIQGIYESIMTIED